MVCASQAQWFRAYSPVQWHTGMTMRLERHMAGGTGDRLWRNRLVATRTGWHR
ncbi:hypothetical protein [Stenomitos frigidus]|uniref:hypothetical protein n=1 Tax=Stenomitos frigidus TaxID=1886765 RepID=UPI00329A208E